MNLSAIDAYRPCNILQGLVLPALSAQSVGSEAASQQMECSQRGLGRQMLIAGGPLVGRLSGSQQLLFRPMGCILYPNSSLTLKASLTVESESAYPDCPRDLAKRAKL